MQCNECDDGDGPLLTPLSCGSSRVGVIRHGWMVAAALVVSLAMTGCALLHRPDDDKLAQSASKSFDDAALAKTLDAEREAVTKTQQDRQELVKRSQFALRDAMLAVVIGGTRAETTWGALKEAIDKRIKDIQGQTPVTLPQNCNPRLSVAQTDREFAVNRTLLLADKVRLAAVSLGERAPLSCAKQPTPLPASQTGNVGFKALVEAYDHACTDLATQQACVSAHLQGGELKLTQDRIDAADDEQRTVKEKIATATKAYEEALAKADSAKATAGAAQALADALQKQLDGIAELAKTVDGLNDKAAKLGFSELANLESLEQRKAVLDTYVKALQGEDPGAKELAPHRAYLIANLVNRASEKPAPPTAGIVLQAELYRQRIANSQARLRRVGDKVGALKARHAALTTELAELQKARGHLAGADSANGGCNQTVSFYESFSAGKGCEIHAGGALLAFNNAWTLGRMPAEQADYRHIDIQEQIALDDSEAALRQSDTVLRASLNQIVKLNAAGIKPEDVAVLWQALGITAIAVRIK